MRALNLRTKRHGKAKTGVNVSQGRSNWSANFLLKMSKVRVSQCSVYLGGRPLIMPALGRHIFPVLTAIESLFRSRWIYKWIKPPCECSFWRSRWICWSPVQWLYAVVVTVCSANPENDQYRRPADPSSPSQHGPQAYLVLDVFSPKVTASADVNCEVEAKA